VAQKPQVWHCPGKACQLGRHSTRYRYPPKPPLVSIAFRRRQRSAQQPCPAMGPLLGSRAATEHCGRLLAQMLSVHAISRTKLGLVPSPGSHMLYVRGATCQMQGVNVSLHVTRGQGFTKSGYSASGKRQLVPGSQIVRAIRLRAARALEPTGLVGVSHLTDTGL